MDLTRLSPLSALPGVPGALWVRPVDHPSDNLILWQGFRPPPASPHRTLAPVVHQGTLDGHHAYTERVPEGVLMSEREPPIELIPWVILQLLEALVVLRDAHLTHGALGAEYVMLGQDGEVVLFGRGRASSMLSLDVLRAMALCPEDERTIPANDPQILADLMRARVAPDHQQRLARWVRSQPRRAQPKATAVLELRRGESPPAGADEVVLDLGPDTGGEGLLDRWDPVTSGSFTPAEHTGERTDWGATAQDQSVALWSRLGAGLAEGPADRFDTVRGKPSEATRAIVYGESPDILPLPGSQPPAPVARERGREPWSAVEAVLAVAAIVGALWVVQALLTL
ncbi:MAG: hypothetical protein JXX28_14460 [Deltaproteobacteria bacterium]|nr:hypothetical protein [Deltaproteobacteria bacterium]